MSFNYYLVPYDIQCVACHTQIARVPGLDAVLDADPPGICFQAACPVCGKAGIITLPIFTARPLPEGEPE